MVRIARHLRQTVLLLRSLRRPPLPMLPLPRRRRRQRPLQGSRALWLAVARLLLRVAAVVLAGVRAQRLHLTTLTSEVRMSLLAETRVQTMAPVTTLIVANVSLPLATLPMAVGAAEALAVAVQVGLVPLAAPVGEKARFLGKSTISIVSF